MKYNKVYYLFNVNNRQIIPQQQILYKFNFYSHNHSMYKKCTLKVDHRNNETPHRNYRGPYNYPGKQRTLITTISKLTKRETPENNSSLYHNTIAALTFIPSTITLR